MFVINFKLDFKKILFACVIIAAVIATIVEFGTNKTSIVSSNKDGNYDYIFDEENYTKYLNQIHENIDANINKTVKINGFVFKMPDFKDTYFVCGRSTISNGEESVAGILCKYDDATKLVGNEWVEITGIITKGDYNGIMPILKVGNITKITAPANTYVDNTNEKSTNTNN